MGASNGMVHAPSSRGVCDVLQAGVSISPYIFQEILGVVQHGVGSFPGDCNDVEVSGIAALDSQSWRVFNHHARVSTGGIEVVDENFSLSVTA